MKMTQKMVLMLGLLCSTVLPQGLALTSENSAISSDIDGLILNKDR